METIKFDKITIHCSDTTDGVSVSVDAIRKSHIARGFSDIGYHFLIQPDGTTNAGRNINIEGAHVEGANKGNLGICMIGRGQFTLSQFTSLRKILDDFVLKYDIKPWRIYCHYEFPSAQKQGKTCPNMRISELICWYNLEEPDAIKNYIFRKDRQKT